MKCRNCSHLLEQNFLDLGFAPVSNGYLTTESLSKAEKYFPLVVKVCSNCWLVQTLDFVSRSELFSDDYAYFSGTSSIWRKHISDYVDHIVKNLSLGENSFVIEIASNDGSLLENFKIKNIPCLGIEPTASTALVAEQKGINVLRQFFGENLAKSLSKDGKKADLIVGNNVYAHVPDINDFTMGIKAILKPGGVVTIEFPHLLQLLNNIQFDTIYHEHYSYFSLHVVKNIFEKAMLRVWDVEEISTHGGSLRVYGCHENDTRPNTDRVEKILTKEEQNGLLEMKTYTGFQKKADKVKDELLMFLLNQKKIGKIVVGYGAAAKGNTLLNYSGVKPDLLPFIVDASLSKQNKFMPGSHIPIVSPGKFLLADFDYVLILPWNIAMEIKTQHKYLMDKGKVFISAIPEITII